MVLGLGVLAVAAGTKLLGWIALPIVGIVIGCLRPDSKPVFTGAGAGGLGWGLLLLWGVTRGPVLQLAGVVGGVFGGLPGDVVILVTLLFPALLTGAAAGTASAARAMSSDRDP